MSSTHTWSYGAGVLFAGAACLFFTWVRAPWWLDGSLVVLGLWMMVDGSGVLRSKGAER